MPAEGLQKSALLLLTLGEEHAAEILKHLEPREVQKLGQAMAATKNISRTDIEEVMTEFEAATSQITTFGMGSSDYIRNVLTKALGEDLAGSLIDRILHIGRNQPGSTVVIRIGRGYGTDRLRSSRFICIRIGPISIIRQGRNRSICNGYGAS